MPTKIDFSLLPYESNGDGYEVVGDYVELTELGDSFLCIGLVATTFRPKLLRYSYSLFGPHMGDQFIVFDIRELFGVEDFDLSVLPIKGDDRLLPLKRMILEKFDSDVELLKGIISTKSKPIQI